MRRVVKKGLGGKKKIMGQIAEGLILRLRIPAKKF